MSNHSPIKPKQSGKNQWVVRHPDGWAVRGEGNSRVTKVTRTQQEAIDAAVTIAARQGSDVIVQGRHGEIRLKEQHAAIKALFKAWDADPDQLSDEWWKELDDLLQGEQVNSRSG